MWVHKGKDIWRIFEGGTCSTLAMPYCEDDDERGTGRLCTKGEYSIIMVIFRKVEMHKVGGHYTL